MHDVHCYIFLVLCVVVSSWFSHCVFVCVATRTFYRYVAFCHGGVVRLRPSSTVAVVVAVAGSCYMYHHVSHSSAFA